MDPPSVRHVLEQIAACLELRGENPFRVRAYQNAAQIIAGYSGDLAEGLTSGALRGTRGIGPGTLEILREFHATGRSSLLDELHDQIPPGVVEMLRIPGLGVARVRQIHEQLHLESLAELDEAAVDGSLAKLPRFGAKTAESVRKGIALLRRSSEFRLFHHALAEAESVRRVLAALDGVERVEIAGSVRRRCEVIRDIDLVAVHGGPAARDALVKRLGEVPGVTELAGKQGAVTLRFESGTVIDVFLAAPDELGVAWVRATGSAAHWAELEARGRALGVALGPGFADEAAVYRALGLAWVPPELREGTGECDAAARGALPRLVDQKDLQGFLHCHTTYSDGTATVAEWARAAREAGYAWIGITDHSEAAVYAGGLRADDVERQHAEIDEVNRTAGAAGCRVLKGVEADILADGALDYGPALLGRFDFVIGSIHSRFAMGEREMTERVLKAMADPHLAILGHPTGRQLLSREPYALDVEQVLARAAETGVALEVNADPHRLDLDWRLVRRARERGATIAIGADAHSLAAMANVAVGVGIARKGWLEARHVLNARDAEGFLAFARGRRPA